MTNKSNSVLYIGVTADIISRVYQHKNKSDERSFTAKYNCNKLVYFFYYAHIEEAIHKEKYLKGKLRQYKIDLINSLNPAWEDLYQNLINE